MRKRLKERKIKKETFSKNSELHLIINTLVCSTSLGLSTQTSLCSGPFVRFSSDDKQLQAGPSLVGDTTVGAALGAHSIESTARMGFLAAGEPLEWDDSIPSIAHVREHGIRQFIRLYDRVAHLQNDKLLYGDELEYQIYKLSQGKVKIALRGAELLHKLNQKEKDALCQKCVSCAWAPEFGAWMVEGTPGKPYHGYAADLLTVEHNMRVRRARVPDASFANFVV